MKDVKKYYILIATILSIMCLVLVFYLNGAESFSHKKDYIYTNTSQNIDNTSRTQTIYKSEPNISGYDLFLTDKFKNQEQTSINNNSQKVNDTQKVFDADSKIEVNNQSVSKDNNEENNQSVSKSDNEGGDKIESDTKIKNNKDENTDSQKYIKRKIDPKKPMIALTFDDGPHYKYTNKILDYLEKYNGAATFFVLGSNAEKNKKVIKRIAESGNEIGNHTYDHKQLTKLSGEEITDEITKTANILEKITGVKPNLLRPTYGSVNDNVKLYSDAPLILWSIDTLDWKSRNKNKVVNAALKKVRDGDIILMHDIYETTAMAAEVIIKELCSRGYQLVTINELYEAKSINLEKGYKYTFAR